MTKFCLSVDVHEIITRATFCDDRLWGLGVASGQISGFPIQLRRQPYNTTTVRVCDVVPPFPGVRNLGDVPLPALWRRRLCTAL